MSIYVEIRIRAPIELLWDRTQLPDLHERWDVRFSRIEYLPRASQDEPQRFLYETRIGFGLEVAGEGESTGQRDLANGSRTSALAFRSSDPRSIIREGSGYWKYIPTADGIRFLTWYDYRTRFGAIGRAVDRVVFRPLLGWATAWSFDRLRLWLESGIEPSVAMRQAVVHGVARVCLAVIFMYQGLVPKLLAQNPDETRMLLDAHVPSSQVAGVMRDVGALECALAVVLLLTWRRSWPARLCLMLMVIATLEVGINSPGYFSAAFNPVSLNLAVAALALIDLLTAAQLTTSASCLRAPPHDDA